MRRYPFLPPGDHGWTPYVWLIYLSFFFIHPIQGDYGPVGWAATGAVVAVFLPLYFWGYWDKGRRPLLAALAIAALGAVSSPWNHGGSVFFIYAAGYLGFTGSQRFAVRCLGGLLAWVALEAWIFDLPTFFWVVGLVFTALIGSINIHYAEIQRRNEALRRSHEEIERLAKVAERERIGRDLHDLLGHTLSLVALKAELAGKLLARDPERAAAEIADVERISRQALKEVREAVIGYRAEGLAAELERADAALAAAGIECRREVEEISLGPDADRALAFALREAVTNVIRHSGAGACTVRVAAGTGGGARLEVVDDGRGGEIAEGAGLAGMRERAEALGGRVERDGGAGCRIVVTLPRRPESDAAYPVRPEPAARGPGRPAGEEGGRSRPGGADPPPAEPERGAGSRRTSLPPAAPAESRG